MDLLVEESYYWNYANHLDFSYLDHPPMVAYLIKLFTIIFGTNEFAVRLPGILCWIICSIYSYRLTELIKPKSGIYSLLLLAVLPFFFIQSIAMTPDLPLIAGWSACLYYLYLTLVKNQTQSWYLVGIAFGLSLLSKYTIVLLLPAIFIYMLFVNQAYKKLLSPQPYLAALIAACFFSPVIYWNINHDWVSFLFQSTRRFNETNEFSFHQLSGLFVLFLTPLGVWSFVLMYKTKILNQNNINKDTQRFIQIFTTVPLLFFAIFSLIHEVKFNWIGPGLLAIIPWISIQIANKSYLKLYKLWLITAVALLIAYSGMIFCITTGTPQKIYRAVFSKFINWNDFHHQVNIIAKDIGAKYKKPVAYLPIDKYNIASELAFYQDRALSLKQINTRHKIIGRNIFGQDSLMYEYWYDNKPVDEMIFIMLCEERYMFDQTQFDIETIALTPVIKFWAKAPGSNNNITAYHYQVVEMKN